MKRLGWGFSPRKNPWKDPVTEADLWDSRQAHLEAKAHEKLMTKIYQAAFVLFVIVCAIVLVDLYRAF